MRMLRQYVATLVACLLVLPAAGQQPKLGPRLQIVPLEGQNAVNYIPIRTVTAPVVEVRDENERPVEGAAVVFKLPPSGPGGTFANGQTSQSAISDFRGQAGVTGYTINDTPGRFNIEITATYQDRTARFLMTQVNSIDQLPPELGGEQRKSGGKLKWVLLGIGAAAGAGLGVYFGTKGSGTPISVGTGPVTVGGPR